MTTTLDTLPDLADHRRMTRFETLREQIARARSNGATLTELARFTGKAWGQIHEYITGRHAPPAETTLAMLEWAILRGNGGSTPIMEVEEGVWVVDDVDGKRPASSLEVALAQKVWLLEGLVNAQSRV